MGSVDSPDQPWPPYGNLKDCTLGFCSIYCPQWCYFVFPPPPPTGDPAGADSSTSGNNFSPLVIAIIGILASAFLLVCYYTVVSRYCNRAGRRRAAAGAAAPPEEVAGDVWRIATRGLDDTVIKSIAVFKYRRGEELVDATDCSVCLSEFMEDERLRLLPKCGHAFHVPCIDTWLKSHSNCPLCRANILPSPSPAPATATATPTAATPPPPPPPPPAAAAPVLPATAHGRALSNLEVELRGEVVQPMRRSVSMDSICQGRVLIADVLRIDIEEELEKREEERRKKAMKRSASSSSGRFDLFGAGSCCRGRSSVLLPL